MPEFSGQQCNLSVNQSDLADTPEIKSNQEQFGP